MSNLKLIEPKRELLKKLTRLFDHTSTMLLIYLANDMDDNNKVQKTLSEISDHFNMYPPNVSRKLNNLAKGKFIKIDKAIEEGTNMAVNVYSLPRELSIFKGWLK